MSNQKLSSCKESIKNCIEKKPITFMKLVSETQCASETVEKYLSEFLKEMKVLEKKGKFRIIYSPDVNEEVVEFYELMLNPTVKALMVILLKLEKPISQIELVATIDKSNPSVSRGLKVLLQKQMIKRNYHAPFSTYQCKNKNKIFKMLEKTHPQIVGDFEKFDVCYPKPSIFLEIHK
ncbi:hypothetical protein OAI97_02050 [Nitrosopumilus sp.]|nr:hypothetical protein [Nitrosopumilus sp.]